MLSILKSKTNLRAYFNFLNQTFIWWKHGSIRQIVWKKSLLMTIFLLMILKCVLFLSNKVPIYIQDKSFNIALFHIDINGKWGTVYWDLGTVIYRRKKVEGKMLHLISNYKKINVNILCFFKIFILSRQFSTSGCYLPLLSGQTLWVFQL